MGNSNLENINQIMKYVKPFIAIAVLILAILSFVGISKNNELQEEMKANCGYQQSEKVYCVCEREAVSQININGNPYFIDSNSSNLNIPNS